jgi:hypothetical protein
MTTLYLKGFLVYSTGLSIGLLIVDVKNWLRSVLVAVKNIFLTLYLDSFN